MKIRKEAICGTLESSDVQITVLPNEGNGIEIDLESVVKRIFGNAIEKTARQVLDELGVTDARIIMVDKGALDCVIRSRMQTAILRACEESMRGKENLLWQKY